MIFSMIQTLDRIQNPFMIKKNKKTKKTTLNRLGMEENFLKLMTASMKNTQPTSYLKAKD